MKCSKYWKVILVVCLLALLTAGVMAYAGTHPTAQLQSPNGEIELSVYRVNADSFRLEYTKGPDWAFSGWSISSVTDFKMGTFSPDSRHGVLVFLTASGEEYYYWTDYETGIGGGLTHLEALCREEKTFAHAVQEKHGPWASISFRFLDWHSSKNWMLFRYTITMVDGTAHSGHFWFDLDANLEIDAVKIFEITD